MLPTTIPEAILNIVYFLLTVGHVPIIFKLADIKPPIKTNKQTNTSESLDLVNYKQILSMQFMSKILE